jgi:GAF domain-containing protein
MARQLGLLERAKLEQEFDQAREMAEKLRILHGLGMAIASAMELEQVLTRIVEAAVFITQAEEGSLLLLDEETQELNLRAQKGLGDRYARDLRIRVDDSLAGEVLQTGKPRRLTSSERSVKVVTGYLVNSILYVPVGIKGQVNGVLVVDNQASQRPFTEDDENLLLVLAGYAAIALENARLLEETERRFQTLAVLHGGGHLAGGESLDANLSGILLGDSDALAEQPLSPEFLQAVVAPCLNAIAELQLVFDELSGRLPGQVSILAITLGWPVPVSLEGATETLQVLQDLVTPWVQEHGAGRRAVLTLALNLVARYRPDLPERDRVDYVTRLLPALETLLSSPLEVSGVSSP